MAIAGFIAFGFLVKAITPEPPAIRREYPFDGLVKELGGVEENKVRSISLSVLLLTFYSITLLVRHDLKVSIVKINLVWTPFVDESRVSEPHTSMLP
jgi:hypothetical protein